MAENRQKRYINRRMDKGITSAANDSIRKDSSALKSRNMEVRHKSAVDLKMTTPADYDNENENDYSS